MRSNALALASGSPAKRSVIVRFADTTVHEQARKLVESFLRFRLAPVDRETMLAAFATHDRFQISYWDAAILEAARSLGCDTVLSEDLSDGQDYAGVRVVNPFRSA
jgi:predicted nucleic acid-binding protein